MGSEKSFDSFLGIETIAETAFGDMDVCLPVNEEDNNYEVTYYNDLVTMFDEISMEPEDTLVDFGCGLGRVLFYCNSRHYCRTVGIENNARVYDRLLTNAASYQSKFLDQEERMRFLNVEAEAYEVGDEDNYFYFFNPFSGATFKKVLDNIIASVRRQPRDIELLIYYPTFEYQKAIRDCNMFVLKKMIKLSGYEEDPDEKVLVYHLSRYFVA